MSNEILLKLNSLCFYVLFTVLFYQMCVQSYKSLKVYKDFINNKAK
jgi:hypothetical protein